MYTAHGEMNQGRLCLADLLDYTWETSQLAAVKTDIFLKGSIRE